MLPSRRLVKRVCLFCIYLKYYLKLILHKDSKSEILSANLTKKKLKKDKSVKVEVRQGEEEKQKTRIKEDKEGLSNKYLTNHYPTHLIYRDLE